MYSVFACYSLALCLVVPLVCQSASAGDDIASLVARVAQLETHLEQMTSKVRTIQASPKASEEMAVGVTYIHWGRTTCDGDALLIYEGHAAGAHHLHGGGGTNTLCLHEDPQFNVVFPDYATYSTKVHGVEYKMSASENYVFSMNNSDGHPLTNYPAPCAACHVSSRTAILMIPARINCPEGWTEEYRGYVVAESSVDKDRHRGEYLCWDEAPEYTKGAAAQDQGLIYTVELASGTLPSSIFIDGIELTCVVCSK